MKKLKEHRLEMEFINRNKTRLDPHGNLVKNQFDQKDDSSNSEGDEGEEAEQPPVVLRHRVSRRAVFRLGLRGTVYRQS